jgi:hypothetical protein
MKADLKYSDENDKCYGLAGMAISIVALDKESLIESMSLDAEPGEAVKFASEFYFSGNPTFSARIAWNEILQHFQLSAAMMISNIMCRAYVHRHKNIPDDVRASMLKLIADEGHDSCSLDDDEISTLFSKNYNYLHRLFNHRGVQDVARKFAKTLAERRSLSRSEVIDELRALSMI